MAVQMIGHFWRRLVSWWQQSVGDRDLELKIRQAVDRLGDDGQSARFVRCQLVAIQRPGWRQVWEFELTACARRLPEEEHDFARRKWFGVARDDTRTNLADIALFQTPDEQRHQVERWSTGMLRRKTPRPRVTSVHAP